MAHFEVCLYVVSQLQIWHEWCPFTLAAMSHRLSIVFLHFPLLLPTLPVWSLLFWWSMKSRALCLCLKGCSWVVLAGVEMEEKAAGGPHWWVLRGGGLWISCLLTLFVSHLQARGPFCLPAVFKSCVSLLLYVQITLGFFWMPWFTFGRILALLCGFHSISGLHWPFWSLFSVEEPHQGLSFWLLSSLAWTPNTVFLYNPFFF